MGYLHGVKMLTIGNLFPRFNLTGSSDIEYSKLSMDTAFVTVNNDTYKGKWKVFFFYPKDFTFICPTEIVGFSNLKAEFDKRNAQILGCSVDSEFVHWAWRTYHKPLNNVSFPILADIKRELSSALGVLNSDGVTDRALFIVDPDDIIRFVMVTDSSVGRNPNEVLRILDALQNGGLCPCSWTRGQETIDTTKAEI